MTHPDKVDTNFTIRDQIIKIEPSVQEWGIPGREGIVHRLDKQTSGLIVCALNKESFKDLQSSFKNRNVYKEYICVVEGKLRTQSGTIEVPLARSSKNRIKRQVSTEGKFSRSYFEVIIENNEYSKLKIELVTGRNHQIRSQMEFIGNPIVNDMLYGAKKVPTLNENQICLHSKKLKFKFLRQEYEFECDEPNFFNTFQNV